MVRFLGRTFDGFQRAIARQSDAWAEGEIDASWVAIDHLEERVRDRPADHDVALVVTDWLADLADAGAIAPLDTHLAAAPPDDWPNGWSPSMRELQTDAEGHVWGLPYHDGPMMLLHRTDLFGDPDEQQRYAAAHGRPLRVPTTWDELVEVARFFTRPHEGLWGLAAAGLPDGHNTVYDFLLQLWSRDGALVDGAGSPAFFDETGLAALTFLHDQWRVHDLVAGEGFAQDSVASGRWFADGHAAMSVNWSGFVAMSADPESPTHGRVGCAPVPRAEGAAAGHVSLNVYWVTVLSSGANDPDEAWRFMRHLASRPMDRVTSEEGATGTRLSTWRDPAVQALSPYYEVIEEIHRNVQSPPQVATFPRIAGAVDAMVHDTITGRRSPAEALAAAAEALADLR